MDDITFIDFINGQEAKLDFGALVALIKGSSIKSLAISEDFFEIGLSDAFNLRIQGHPEIMLISTLNKGELPPIRLQIIKDDEAATAEAIEKRLHLLRQLYAIAFLINAGRSEEVVHLLEKNPQADLEAELLKDEDRLLIKAASEGSFWLTVLTKTKAAYTSLSCIASLFYDEGRQALLKRVRANTELKKIEVEQKKVDLNFRQATNLIELIQKIEKIKDPHIRETVRNTLSSNMEASGKQPLALPEPDNRQE